MQLHTYHRGGQQSELVRIVQKGDLATGVAGAHADGHVDALETLTTMITSEILHRQGIYTTRTLLAARLRGIGRQINHDPSQNAPAGVELRVGDRPRIGERDVAPYFRLAENSVPNWTHPLIVGGLEFVPAQKRALMISAMNEAMMKDLWILHGSLSSANSDLNRAEAVIDLATMAFLSAPNMAANIKGGATNFYDEMTSAKGLDGKSFHDSFLFLQLRRLGVPDSVILENYFKLVHEPMGAGALVRYHANPAGRKLVDQLFKIFDFHGRLSGEQFYADPNNSNPSDSHPVFNTRKMLSTIVLQDLLSVENLSREQLQQWMNSSEFERFNGRNPIFGEYRFLADSIRQDFREIHRLLRPLAEFVAANRQTIIDRQGLFPQEQSLPSREQIRQQAIRWLSDPFAFGREFKTFVEGFDSSDQRDLIRRHDESSRSPRPPAAEAIVVQLTSSCNRLQRGEPN